MHNLNAIDNIVVFNYINTTNCEHTRRNIIIRQTNNFGSRKRNTRHLQNKRIDFVFTGCSEKKKKKTSSKGAIINGVAHTSKLNSNGELTFRWLIFRFSLHPTTKYKDYKESERSTEMHSTARLSAPVRYYVNNSWPSTQPHCGKLNDRPGRSQIIFQGVGEQFFDFFLHL